MLRMIFLLARGIQSKLSEIIALLNRVITQLAVLPAIQDRLTAIEARLTDIEAQLAPSHQVADSNPTYLAAVKSTRRT